MAILNICTAFILGVFIISYSNLSNFEYKKISGQLMSSAAAC